MDLDKLDPKHKALLALVAAAEALFSAACATAEEKYPGSDQEKTARAALDEKRAHLCISIQAGSGHVKAALALIAPEFIPTIEEPWLELNASLESIFAEKSRIIDLAKLN